MYYRNCCIDSYQILSTIKTTKYYYSKHANNNSNMAVAYILFIPPFGCDTADGRYRPTGSTRYTFRTYVFTGEIEDQRGILSESMEDGRGHDRAGGQCLCFSARH